MMKILKKSFALLLTTAFCLGLTACGSSDDMAGEDWRTTGVVVGSGTITHTGEGSVDVLVTVDENSAAFYRDEQNQILFDSVAFPMTISDAKKSFNDISFDDINGDGESDVCVSFVYAPGESTQMVWVWDAEERYVFREELSMVTTGSGNLIDSVNDTVLFPVEEIQSSVPYFTRNGLEINAAMDKGTFLLENKKLFAQQT